MRQPKPILLGYSWLGMLNMFLLQWFFFRLQATCVYGLVTEWKIIGPVVPLTGWWSKYIFLGKNNT